MYVPEHFAERRLEALHGLIAAHPLGALVRQGEDGLTADHLPFELAAPVAHPDGVLLAHVARANPLAHQDGASVMVVFQAASAYVSPTLYDLETLGGRAVPTWNYAVVHAHGRLRVVDDDAWVLAHLRRATQEHEGRKSGAWSVDDAPPDYIARLLRAVIGIEIVVERLEGKSKLSQNRSAAERERILRGR